MTQTDNNSPSIKESQLRVSDRAAKGAAAVVGKPLVLKATGLKKTA